VFWMITSERSVNCYFNNISNHLYLRKSRFIFLSLYHFSLILSVRQIKKALMKTNPPRIRPIFR
jgi:hypothetical protein